MKSILDKDFRYVCAAATDVRATFAAERERIRREQELALMFDVVNESAKILKQANDEADNAPLR